MKIETGESYSESTVKATVFTVSPATRPNARDILNTLEQDDTVNSGHRPLRRIATYSSTGTKSPCPDEAINGKRGVERAKSARIGHSSPRKGYAWSASDGKKTGSIHMSLTRVPSGATQNAATRSSIKRKKALAASASVHKSKSIKETSEGGEWASIDITQSNSAIVPRKRESTDSLTPSKLTRQEYLTIACLCLGHFSLGTVYALMAPFFPSESERKGVTSTWYGIVFGVFEMGQFVFSPIAGAVIPHVGPKFSLVIGMFICGWCTTVFGLLQWSPPRWTFFGLSFTLRLVSSIGGSAYFCASFTIIATEFADRISTLFSLTEVFFGVGMIVGPSVGGVLFEHGGFSLPFFVTGAEFFTCALFAFFALKSDSFANSKDEPDEANTKKATVLNLSRELGIMINMSITLIAFINIGFNDATLEHHVSDKLKLKPSQIGLLFLLGGGIYAISTQIWGFVMQKFDKNHLFVLFGFFFEVLALLILGPAWPLSLHIPPSLLLIIIGQCFYGVSMGPQLVGSFTGGLSETLKAGYPDDLTTSATMSSLYQSVCALGSVYFSLLCAMCVVTLTFVHLTTSTPGHCYILPLAQGHLFQ